MNDVTREHDVVDAQNETPRLLARQLARVLTEEEFDLVGGGGGGETGQGGGDCDHAQ